MILEEGIKVVNTYASNVSTTNFINTIGHKNTDRPQ
jgi:hypothetical protein